MTVAVLVPTYRRPRDLARCLEALKKQTRLPDKVLVVVRDTDTETRALLTKVEQDLLLRVVRVKTPGTVAAVSAGLNAAREDIIAITDDDAAPHPDWLARVEAHFQADPKVGGVGGRDWVHDGKRVEDGIRRVVGKVQWFGRLIGNHHLGGGGPREVDVLKGANCAYRRAAIWRVGFDKRLLGTGAQVYWELSLGLQLRRAGWKLVYDPAVAVDHYVAPRFDEDQRYRFNAKACTNEAHNETLVLLEHLTPIRRLLFIVWAVLVGTRTAPGLVWWLRLLLRDDRLARAKLQAALGGRVEGWKTWRLHNV